MNLNVYLGKENNGENLSLDFAKNGLNLTLLLGATGTGKSVFHFQLYKELIKQNRSDEIGFYFIDNTRIDFNNFSKAYLIQLGLGSDAAFKIMGDVLEELRGRELGQRSKNRAIFLHIEECDQFAVNPEKTAAFYKDFISLKQGSNIYVIYSTSRPAIDVLPDWLIEKADMKVVFGLASETDCQRVLGNNSPLTFKPGERIVAIKNKFITCQPFSNEELRQIQDFENGK